MDPRMILSVWGRELRTQRKPRIGIVPEMEDVVIQAFRGCNWRPFPERSF